MYAGTEENILNSDITVGVIGIPREQFDCMMIRERTSRTFDMVKIDIIDFKFPEPVPVT